MTGITAPTDVVPRAAPHTGDTARSRHPRTVSPGVPGALPDTRQELALDLATTDPVSPGYARRATADALRSWGVAESESDEIVLMAHELVTNAVEHARGPVRLRLRLSREHCVICDVGDGSRETPRLRQTGPDAESGRGLTLVDALSDSFGTRPTPTGKITWFRRSVCAPMPTAAHVVAPATA
ncbi:ATP-binding protein [Streptomyces sp. 3N207]|uniref:ATP-binding protein n=1 Tax=Streptomyces sp. 3N207 TaxID=3457417 RepID=UPI003FD36EB6